MSGSYINRKSLLKGAFLVTGAAFIGKVLSALYRVPFQNITGDLGYYVYQQVYPFYGAAMVISMYGFPVIISKAVMEAFEEQGREAAKETALAAFFTLLLLCVPAFLVLFLGAGATARAMGDEALVVPLGIIAFVFLFIPLFSAGRGYFQGIGDMRPTAVSHLLEQFVRVACILVLALLVINKGPYAAGAAAAVGSIAGSLFGAVYICGRFVEKKSEGNTNWAAVRKKMKNEHTKVLARGILVSLGAMIFILYQLIDAFTVARLLQANGMPGIEAKAAKGIFDRGQPLLQFGTVIATSIAISVVPLISRERLMENNNAARRYAGISVRVSILIGAAAALGLFIIASSVNFMLFENIEGTDILRILAITLTFSGLVMATSAVMEGHNFFSMPAITLLIGLLVKAAGNLSLIPLFHAEGAAAATVLGMAVTAAWNLFFIYKRNLMVFTSFSWLCKAGVALGIMGLTTGGLFFIYEVVNPYGTRIEAAVLSLVVSGFGACIFLWMVLHLSLFTKEERMLLPGMDKVENIRFMFRKEKRRKNDL